MEKKTLIKTFIMSMLIISVFTVCLHTFAAKTAKLSQKGYEEYCYTGNGDLIVTKIDGKYGLTDKRGNTLVEHKYDDFTPTTYDGYTIFYDLPENLSISGFKNISFGFDLTLEENLVVDEVFAEAATYAVDTDKRVTSSNYNLVSYVYDKNGKLIYEGNKEFVSSCCEGLLEIRTNPHAFENLEAPGAYTLEYKRALDGKSVYELEECTASTMFHQGRAAVVKNYYKDLELYIIDNNGNLVKSKNQKDLATIHDGWWYVTSLSFFSSINDGMINFMFNDMPAAGEAYLYNINDDSFKTMYWGQENHSYWYFGTNGYTQIYFDGVYVCDDWDGNKYLVSLSADGDRIISESYPDLSPSMNSKYFIVSKDDKWGYIDSKGNELKFYKDTGNFVNGRALVIDDSGKAYAINEAFQQISDPISGAVSVSGSFVKKEDGLRYLITNFDELNGKPELSVKLNGKKIEFDQPPIIKEGRTLVPLRAIFEALDATVLWDDSTKTVTSTKADTTITVTINSNIMTKNGEEIVLDVPAQLVNDRTLVPARAVVEAFGGEVEWDADNQCVILTIE